MDISLENFLATTPTGGSGHRALCTFRFGETHLNVGSDVETTCLL